MMLMVDPSDSGMHEPGAGLRVRCGRSVRPIIGTGRPSNIRRHRAAGIKGARVVLSQREAHEHADSGRKRHRNQKANETKQIAERE